MGDGSRASKAEAKQPVTPGSTTATSRTSTYSHPSPPSSSSSALLDASFRTWRLHGALGPGTTQGGGKPSTSTDGHLIAQGNTAEKAVARVLGHPERGQQGQPWDRVNGTGFVAACDGDYADAIDVKHFPVDRLFMAESYGTVSKASAEYIGWCGAMHASNGSRTGPFMAPTTLAPAASTCTTSLPSRTPLIVAACVAASRRYRSLPPLAAW